MQTLTTLQAIRLQINAFFAEVEKLKGSEFPYLHSKNALECVESHFRKYDGYIRSLDARSDPAVVASACNAAHVTLSSLLPLLGFILRSTNIRNAFEVYGPLLRLARAVVDPDCKLLVSSEWDFVPFTFIGYRPLPNYVLIGLPATESANPFLVPLAGHELGHSIWDSHLLENEYRTSLETNIIKAIKGNWIEYHALFPDSKEDELESFILARLTWQPAWIWAMRQIEESFCDFVGLFIFGEAYLHAFVYFLSAVRSGPRSIFYPNTKSRVHALVDAANQYRYETPQNFSNQFEDLEEPSDQEKNKKFLLHIADEARQSLIKETIDRVENLLESFGVEKRSTEKVDECRDLFSKLVPSSNAASLANILNGAWKALLDPDLWKDADMNDRKEYLLTEIVLKAIEVLEIEERLAKPL